MKTSSALLVAVFVLAGCGAPAGRTASSPRPTPAPAGRDLEGTVQDNAGRPPAQTAYNYTWDVVVVLRDGKTLRQKFHAPAPQQAPTGQFGVDTGQIQKLRADSGQWLGAALAQKPPEGAAAKVDGAVAHGAKD